MQVKERSSSDITAESRQLTPWMTFTSASSDYLTKSVHTSNRHSLSVTEPLWVSSKLNFIVPVGESDSALHKNIAEHPIIQYKQEKHQHGVMKLHHMIKTTNKTNKHLSVISSSMVCLSLWVKCTLPYCINVKGVKKKCKCSCVYCTLFISWTEAAWIKW